MEDRFRTIACFGEAMIELNIDAPGRQIGFAGDVLNTAIYLARDIGETGQVEFVSTLGQDVLSEKMLGVIRAEGVGTGRVARHDTRLPGIYSIAVDAAGERSFSYWRDQSAARTTFSDGFAQLDGADVVYFSGISLAILPAAVRDDLLDHLKAHPAVVVFDSNYRPRLWEDRDTARRYTESAWRITDIALPSLDDEMALFGDDGAADVLARLRGWGLSSGALKRGAEGPVALDPSVSGGLFRPAPVVVDTTAAGDSFNGAYLSAVLKGAGEIEAMERGHACAAHVVGQKGAIVPRVD